MSQALIDTKRLFYKNNFTIHIHSAQTENLFANTNAMYTRLSCEVAGEFWKLGKFRILNGLSSRYPKF